MLLSFVVNKSRTWRFGPKFYHSRKFLLLSPIVQLIELKFQLGVSYGKLISCCQVRF